MYFGKLLKQPWSLHEKTKYGIAFIFFKSVEGLSDPIHNFTAFKEKGLSYNPIFHSHNTKDAETPDSDDIDNLYIQQDMRLDNTYYNSAYSRSP